LLPVTVGGRSRTEAPLRWLALAGYTALLAVSAPRWPDDWDGIGFVESVREFDLARFRPHPPGYPVYVALLRVAVVVAREPMRACILVAVASGACAAVFLWAAAHRLAGPRAAWAVAGLAAVVPLAWRADSGVGSEAPALAFAAASAWALISARAGVRPALAATALGLGAGLGAGVRLSWAPIDLSLLALAPAGERRRAWVAAAAGALVWAVPLLLRVGPAHLIELYSAHFAGHAERWGATAVTDPGPRRIAWLARDLVVDGLGAGPDAAGLAIGAVGALAGAQALWSWRRAGWPAYKAVLVVAVPYLLWIGVGQNLRDQPRHALPLVVLAAAALALPAARSARSAALVGALGVLVSVRTALDAYGRRTVPPAGQQLVDLARAQPAPERLAVFGVSSVRFFEPTDLADHAFSVASPGDAVVRLTRLPALPTRVWATNEIPGAATVRWPVEHVATLCRPPRLDRRAPCLDVFAWKLSYLPVQ
jgi:hypothetical protein